MDIMRKHFKARIAGLVFELDTTSPSACVLCRNYLCDDDPDLRLKVTKADVDQLLFSEPRRHTKVSAETTAALIKVIEAVIPYGILMMHGAVVATNNQAYMFTAPSGVGKSTRAKIWLKEFSESFVVNGDKPLIKFTNNEILACGTPWCGNEGWNVNTTVPLRAIFLLERAEEGEQSSIEEVSLGKAFPFLLQQTYRPEDPDLMKQTLSLMKELEDKVKIYKYRSTPTKESIHLAYETARPR